MKINPSDQAFPIPEEPGIRPEATGLPIRLELAARCMASIITNSALLAAARNLQPGAEAAFMAESSLDYADALITAYNEGQE